MKFLLAILILLSPPATAGSIKVLFSGWLEQWSGKQVYDAQVEPDLSVPTPDCVWEFSVNLNAVDSLPNDPTRGVYTSPDSSVTFRFGPFEETHWGATIEVWSGFRSGSGYLWGFLFKNNNQISAFGVYRPANTGIYAFYSSTDSMVAPYVIPNDSLKNVISAAGHSAFLNGTHAYMNGVAGYPPVFIHAETDTVQSVFTAKIVP